MFTTEQIVAQHINLAIQKTKYLPDILINKITNDQVKLKDYQYLVSRIFIGLKSLNSMLLFWDTGFGKTLSAVYIMKYIKELFPIWTFLILIKKSLYLDPWLSTIKSYLDSTDNIIFVYYDSTTSMTRFNNIYRSIESSINKKSRILIIIDEVHQVISRTIQKDNTIRNFDRIFKRLIKLANHENNKLLCMSATPITNTVLEFSNLINLLRPNIIDFKEEYIIHNNLINFKELRESLFGICSYKRLIEADSFTNTEYSEGFAKKNVLYHKVKMSNEQSILFDKAEIHDRKSELGGLKTMRRLITSFAFYDLKIKGDLDPAQYNNSIKKKLNEFIGITNEIIFSNDFKNKFKNSESFSTIDSNEINNYKKLFQYSCKYMEACKIILNSRGKVLLYEPLVTFEGIATLKQYFKAFKISFIEYSNKTINTRDYDITLFNRYENNNGNEIKVCIFSAAGSEGISFTCINDIIILDLPWKESELKQIMGRAIRLNSHMELEMENRYVTVHFIISYTINDKSVDEEILNLIKQKKNNISVLFNLLKSVSIEHIHNTYKNIEPIENEYIFDTLRRTKMKELNITNVVANILVTPIFYCNEDNISVIFEGYLDKKNNIVYSNNIPIATIKLDNSNRPIFIIVEDKLVYITKNYYE
ncbi:nucleoside triphosphate phosphohydrolase I [Alphaentomopoxvirus acuprea]|uniref:Nucleoside triphosphatase I n=1 Tax=Alphaentomopoxvirus acuprea TaxID=62099 RepID=W6JPK4_9POXV|nr:nucleoside triphosphate phosphohydrolase I [Anomala cuprea entomopoxvirus]BAO49434.1 nucleoside triphosphate phosphohydrolase I [Anomala cuprea entomopoxvirus]